LACARTRIDDAKATRIRGLVQQQLNWPHLIRLAFEHGVLPLLYWNLRAICQDAVPNVALAELERGFARNSTYNLVLCNKLLTIVRWFEEANIPAIQYKGPVLATSVYGGLFLRQSTDLDVLLHKHDFARAKALLVAHGYRGIRGYGWETTVIDPDDRVCVDLHQNVVPQYIPLPLDFARIWERRQALCIASATVPIASAEDTLILLCCQAAKDEWDSATKLAKITDIVELLHSRHNLDWERIFDEAKRLRAHRMLLFGLSVAKVLLEIELPPEVLSELSLHSSVNSLVVGTVKRFFAVTGDDRPTTRAVHRLAYRFRFHFRTRECLRDKLYPFFSYPLALPKLYGVHDFGPARTKEMAAVRRTE